MLTAKPVLHIDLEARAFDGYIFGRPKIDRVRALQRAAEREGISLEEMERRALNKLVIGRRVGAEDTAKVILFLASEHAATITGEVVVADGGETPAVRF